MRILPWHLSACLLIASSADLAAQRGGGYSAGSSGLSPRSEVTYLKAHKTDAAGTTHWFQLLILWRGQPGWAGIDSNRTLPDTSAMARALGNYNAAHKAALMNDAMFLGGYSRGVAYYAELDSARTTLKILNRSFRVPPRDSALIVLVDRTDGVGGVPTVTRTVVVDGRFPEPPTPKTWTSGDTIFTIRVPDRDQENLLMVLQRDPAVAAFWR
jgi:hypothetical protein